MTQARLHRFALSAALLALYPAAASLAQAVSNQAPDLGPNVLVVNPSQPQAQVQAAIDKIYATQAKNEFGPERNAILFLPGSYKLDVPVGFYTEVFGLGASPDAVSIEGNVHSDASLPNNNATCSFWRGVEGFSVTPTGGSMQWAVSQAAPMRRMHIHGDLLLHQKHGWVSGGWMADTLVDGKVDSGTQQQWISRNSDWGSWSGSSWNMVFVGVPHAPAGSWPQPAYTEVAATPVVREKPYLQVSSAGVWSVRRPALTRNSSGITWAGGQTPGQDVPLSRFYIARPDRDTAATMNAQLARGKHLLLTPGIYDLSEPLRVNRADTIVLGLGFATLRATQGNVLMQTADVDGLTIAGLLFDAGPTASPVLLQVGPSGSRKPHHANPASLQDVFFREGGPTVGKAVVNLEVNSSDTLIDHTWIWRADHGNGVGWDKNLSRNGLVVNGDDVTAYGLFVEHHQQYQVVWRGERGRTYMYQSEIPYDPPTQAAYMSSPDTKGWASYEIADTVREHEAWGLGVYSVFTEPHVALTRAIEAPHTPAVRFHDMITVCLLNHEGIDNIIDDKGGAATCVPHNWPRLASFP